MSGKLLLNLQIKKTQPQVRSEFHFSYTTRRISNPTFWARGVNDV
jgi:hypothetical protein